MSIDRGIDKEDVAHIYEYNGILLSHKNKNVPFAEMWIVLDTVIQNEVKSEREKQITYINAYMWNLEKRYRRKGTVIIPIP